MARSSPPVDAEAAVAPAPAPRRVVGRLWNGIGPYLVSNRRRMVVFTVASTLGGLVESALLYLVVRLATALAAGDESVSTSFGPIPEADLAISEVFVVAFAMVAVLVALSVVQASLAARMSEVALTNARSRTFDAFMAAEWDVQARERAGHLQELLTTHVKRVAQGVLALTDGITASVSFLAFLVSAVLISPVAATTILAGVVVLYLVLRPLISLTRTRSQAHAASNTRYAVSVAQTVELSREIRAFDVGETVRAEVADEADEAARLGTATRLLGKLSPKLYQSAALLLVVAGMAGVHAADVGDVGDLGAVVLLLVRALTYSQGLQAAIQQANEVAPYIEVLGARESLYASRRGRDGTEALEPVRSVAVAGLSFAYDVEEPVLVDLGFEVGAGETIGIVGPSGSGKSTLVQLLLRLRNPDTGRYEVNGAAASSYRSSSWYGQVAFVPQDNQLLTATVADNIRFHRPLTEGQVERAARLAHLHDEIVALPEGYATVVGSGAKDLSGGQRQRLGLARALAGSPSVLVLDEPTSALDMRSESLVQQTLDELHGTVTMFIVAHRLSTIGRCNRIMVLREGRLEAFDEPEVLARTNDFYREALRLSQLP